MLRWFIINLILLDPMYNLTDFMVFDAVVLLTVTLGLKLRARIT